MFPPAAFIVTPSPTMMSDKFSETLSTLARVALPLPDGGFTSSVAVNTAGIVASTNISTFMMMSRNGTMFSSPPASDASCSCGWDRRRILERCAGLSG
jgi:hypothetical protein